MVDHLQSTNHHLPLVVIAGPTASGKTSLAIEIAKIYGGEIICADSRSIYKGMDIGTAKPSHIEQAGVLHWGLDLVDPAEYFSVADFKAYALKKIDEIRLRGNIPFLVGGTGLYIDAIIFDYQFGEKADMSKREQLSSMTLAQLYDYCSKNNISLPENNKNKRYIVRAIELNGVSTSRRECPIDNTVVVGIATDKNVLRTRIGRRIEQLFADGVVDEAKILGEKYGWSGEAMKGNVYPLAHSYFIGEITLEEMKTKLITLDWRLAKRQLTWLRRNPFIKWMLTDDARLYLLDRLAKQD